VVEMGDKNIHTRKHLESYRKELRNNATVSEKRLWKFLQKSQLENRKFRRQQSIGIYIVDFYCASEKLIIELDGYIHDNTVNQEYDFKRTTYLESLDYTVIRFKNDEVKNSIQMVLDRIKIEFII
jgi:very-short-patch-repair endonuclease